MAHAHSGGANSTMNATCNMEMLWNWNVVDSCFLASSWHITNQAIFAASCVGAAFLVITLELCRRVGRDYDALILRQWQRQCQSQQFARSTDGSPCDFDHFSSNLPVFATFRATGLQQMIRAIIHGITIGLAYIVMLLIMHYNGFIFISVVLGAILGKFLCDWMVVRLPLMPSSLNPQIPKAESNGPSACCA